MAEFTLLEYIQDIASSLDSDEVSNYDDSVESLQIAKIIRTVYNDLQARADLPEHYTLFSLTASGDNAKPVLMTRPSDANSIVWVQYNKVLSGDTDPVWQEVYYKPLEEFLAHTDQFKVSDTEVAAMTQTIGSDTVQFIYRNDRAPNFFTTYNDSTILFDSFDSEVDTTLQSIKTRCYGRKDKAFTMSNSFVPFLDRDLSTLLLNESKLLAFAELKQMGHEEARKWANRGWTKMQKQKRAINQDRSELDRAPNYAR